MKDEILKLRSEGKGYKAIAKELNCSVSNVRYHCDPKERDRNKQKQRKSRSKTIISNRIEHFADKVRSFQRRQGRILGKRRKTFSDEEALNWLFPIGVIPKCYLTGKPINITETKSWQLDHIIPPSKGGDNELKNMGLSCREANQAKSDLTVDEFLLLCKNVLEYNGYEVRKRKSIGDENPFEAGRA